MSKPYLFTFWEPVKGTPAYIKIARQLIEQHLSDVFEHVPLNLESARQWCAQTDAFQAAARPFSLGKSTSWDGRRMALFTDLLRIDLLRQYGGLWMDADTLVHPRARAIAGLVSDFDFFCGESEQLTLANGIMGGRKNSPFLQALHEHMSDRLNSKGEHDLMHWGELGFKLIEEVFLQLPEAQVFIAPYGTLIQGAGLKGNSVHSHSSNYESIIAPEAMALSMSNSSTPQTLRDASVAELLSADTVFSRFHDHSIGGQRFPQPWSGDQPCFNLANYLRAPIDNKRKLKSNQTNLKNKLDERTKHVKKLQAKREDTVERLKQANERNTVLREQLRKTLVQADFINEDTHRQSVFSEIYQHGLWLQGGSRSGCGSSMRQTETLRETLPAFLEKWQIKSLLDIPCGDFNWMQKVDLQGIKYIGADIVPELVEDNLQYQTDRINFIVADIVRDELPTVDCVLIRDCFSHLTFKEITAAFNNLIQSGSRHILVTHYLNQEDNADIKTGDFHRLNYTLPPFSFAAPRDVLIERHPNPKQADKTLALWELADIAHSISQASLTESA